MLNREVAHSREHARRGYVYWYRRWRQAVKWNLSRPERARRWRMMRKRKRRMRSLEDQLTTHFHVSEFDTHDGTPVPREAIDNLRELCRRYLEPMRKQFGAAQVLSGYRHKVYNARIGGASLSFHRYTELYRHSCAADVRFARGSPAEWAAAAKKLGAGGVGRYDRASFVHVDSRERDGYAKARWTG